MKYAIGIDLGGTQIKFALVADDGSIIRSGITDTEAQGTRDMLINKLENCAREVLLWASEEGVEVDGIGIGTPGVIDNGLVLGGAENLPDWESLPLGGMLSRRLEYPVYVDNDANLMGLAEVRYGSAAGTQDAIFLTIGTGVGGAMVLNGELYGGHRNRGAELGHIIIDSNGEECSCGAIGCLEAHGSTSALVRDYKSFLKKSQSKTEDKINGKYIIQKYHEHEGAAVQAMNRHFDYLAQGIASFINVFSPQKVIIGGGISEAGEFYVENIRKRVTKQVMKETSIFTQIERAQLGNKAGFLGAAALVFDQSKITEPILEDKTNQA
ncbi:ROK family protein [Puteibacter caeruleilacunae]|nr:ROK family protein [Puteibacter caeruleilacunae]